MAFIYAPPPTYDEILRDFTRWVSRLYGVQIVYSTDDGRGNVSTVSVGAGEARPKCPKCGGRNCGEFAANRP